MKFVLSLKFNKHSRMKREIEAESRADIDTKIEQNRFLNSQKDRLTIETRQP